MLRELLGQIAAEGRADAAELAQRMGVSPALIQEILDTLARQGYLQRIDATPTPACAHCFLHSGCLAGGQARLWALSAKGDRLLASQAKSSQPHEQET